MLLITMLKPTCLIFPAIPNNVLLILSKFSNRPKIGGQRVIMVFLSAIFLRQTVFQSGKSRLGLLMRWNVLKNVMYCQKLTR